MVVADVLGHQSLVMMFIEHNYMVQQIAPAVANSALSNAVLPRTFEGCGHRLQPDGLDGFPDFGIEDRVAVVDQVFLSRIVGECFAQLLGNPRAAWMRRDVEVQHTPPVMGNDEEAVEDAKSERRHGEEIHGGDGLPMIAQK